MIAEGLLDRFRRPGPRAGRPKAASAVRTPPRPAVPRAAAPARRHGLARFIPRPKLLILIVVLGLALGGGWLWLRDSSLVAVEKVQITGVQGANAEPIRRALRASARTMTTLDVRLDQLRMAVSPYPIVKSVSVSTHFPHGMTIHVVEQEPVGAVTVDGRTIAIAPDGTLLPGVPAAGFPAIPLKVPPGGSRVSDPAGAGAVAVLAAAPRALLGHITQVTTVAGHGLVAQIQNGPSLYFGDTELLDAKWKAAVAVLADGGSSGALYIDVTDPERPAAGAGSGSGSSGTTSSGSSGNTGSSSGSAPGG